MTDPPEKRPPYPGDVLQNPQRTIVMVDRNARTFCCEPLEGTPAEHYGAENLPDLMRDAPFGEAPIEPGWTEVPKASP